MVILALLYFVSACILTFRRFEWGVYLCVALLPTYIIRLNIGPLPTSVLELTFFAVVLVGVIKITRDDINEFKRFIFSHKIWCVAIVAFLLCSLGGAFTAMIGALHPMQKMIEGIGEWRAMFLEPVMLCTLILMHQRRIEVNKIIGALLMSAVAVSVIALIQKFTGVWFPPSIEHTYLFGRVTSVYTSANAIGLFTVPIMFLSVLVWRKHTTAVSIAFLLMLGALLFSQSQGALIALGAGTLVYLWIKGNRKVTVGIAVAGIFFAVSIPSLREAMVFADRAGQNRIMLWKHTVEYLTESPSHFILGSGIRNFFDAIQSPWYDLNVLEALKYPHNIFLNFWTEIGFLGMILFVAIFVYLVRMVFLVSDTTIKAVLLAVLTAIAVHGLVDVPYFKNDLAMLFWIIVFLVVTSKVHVKKTKKIF